MRKIIDYIRMLLSYGKLDFAGRRNFYTFKKGDFYARGSRTIDRVGHQLRFQVTFDYDCYYKEPKYNTQINKLYGVSEKTNRHKDSMRIGWQAAKEENMISLYAYYYIDGVRDWNHICDVLVGHRVNCEIKRTDLYWIVTVEDKTFSVLVRHIFKENLRRLYPYFGGEVPSPKPMLIVIDEI